MKRHHIIFTLMLTLLSVASADAAVPISDSITKATILQCSSALATAQDLSGATAAATDPLFSGASAGKMPWFLVPGHPLNGVLIIDKP